MSTILDKIIANKKQEVESLKKEVPLNVLLKQIKDTSKDKSFRQSLDKSSTGIIAEFKRKSPSRDWIFKDAQIEEVVPFYSLKGASAISILTDYDFFGGTLSDLERANSLVDIPILRKDFIIDEYQICQAKLSGADVILLIASALTIKEVQHLAIKARELGLEVLLEIHEEKELDYLSDKIDVVGINNRNLKTFVTDVDISFKLGEKISNDFLKISESGISRAETVLNLREAGFKGFLMGENFMKTNNPGKALDDFIKQLV